MNSNTTFQVIWSDLIGRSLLTGASFLIFLALSIFMVFLISRYLKIKYIRDHKIVIKNESNFISKFMLILDSVEQNLHFQVFLNGIPLPRTVSGAEVDSNTISLSSRNKTISSQVSSKDETSRGNILKETSKSGRAITAKLGVLASLTGTLGSLLPGGLGSKLSSQSQALRQTQTTVQETVQAPVAASQKFQSLNQQGGQLLNQKNVPSTVQKAELKNNVPLTNQGLLQQKSEAVFPENIATGWIFETPAFEPGKQFTLLLQIEAAGTMEPKKAFKYTISSHQIPLQPFDVLDRGEQLDGLVYFAQKSMWRKLVSPVLNILFSLIFVFAFIYSLDLIW